MDITAKLKHLVFYLLFFLFLMPSESFSQSAPVGSVDLAGWIKGTDGTYSKAFPDNTSTRTAVNNILTSSQQALVQTSKGIQTFDIDRSSTADIARFGKVVRGLAVVAGPVGMGVTAAALVCELTTICNQAGQWMMGATDPYPTLPNTYPLSDGSWTGWNNVSFPNPTSGCSYQPRLDANVAQGAVFHHIEQIDAANYRCYATHPSYGSTVFYASNTSKLTGCASQYTLNTSTSTCEKTGLTQPHVATSSDWDAKQPLLNDVRFMGELMDKLADIPIGLPTMTNTPKKVISEDTTVTKDQNGNATGSKVTTTEAEIVDAATAESPGRVIVKEKTTVSNYDINNTLINSTTSTSYTNQPPPDKPSEPITISFDDVPDSDIEQEEVDADLETPESWGDGFCPADETINYHYGTLTFDFQPTCDFAIEVKPVLLFIAAISAMFIISGVKVE
ncbi:virulence factor TspB C-terminal domain-related protein [Nitrosomonas sp. Nm166]|uniref:virulence factor TspB C-terminal domain-related protein n=1 Tax=Nitrosomonas sp. Nm166 TaxID=1881054 RepID=UPI0008F1BD46|nr:virulence factor TspB C-terminal domain-related protein [Nitrosomonas sp. Nm166]SFF12727.1 hypothetical protein SAMN05428977_105319 [Nitrosomonas sp. Nm166]